MMSRRQINHIEITPRNVVTPTLEDNQDHVSIDYTLSDDETKEDIHIRIAQNV